VPEEVSRTELKEQARALARKTQAVVATALDPSSLPGGESGAGVSLETNV